MADLRTVFDREILASFQNPQPLANAKFYQSGAFATSPQLRPLVTSGATKIDVPFINPIDGNLESNYGNTIFTDIAMPRKIDGGRSTARVAFLNEGFVESRLERFLLGESPLALMAGMIDRLWAEQADHRAIASLIGVLNADQGGDKALITDISKASATEATGFSVDAFLDAEGTLSEAYQGTGAMIVHPLIATKLRKQQLVERVTTSANLPPVEYYNGRQVIVSKKGTQIGTGANAKFVTFLLGNGAVAADVVRGNDDLELERTASTGNGAGHTVLWTRRNMLIHPQGFSFVADDSTLTGGTVNEALSASWSDLTAAANWRRDADAESIGVRFLITNL